LRAATDQEALGERTVWIDCDVIQADGGTRTASITGAFVALALAFERLVAAGTLKSSPLIDTVRPPAWALWMIAHFWIWRTKKIPGLKWT